MPTTRTFVSDDVDTWFLTAPVTPAAVTDIINHADGRTLTAHPATLEAMCRARSPFGPLARSEKFTERVLGCPVVADRAITEGCVLAH